jgi:putative ABC transport system substrate-binding protein
MTRDARQAASGGDPSSRRRHIVLGGLLLGAGMCGAQTRPVPLVGVLVATGLAPLDGLRQGLKARGLVEGRDFAIAFRSADGNPRDLPRLARHIAGLGPKVMFCAGPAAVDAAVHATSTVPIVALDLETDALRSGLVRAVQRPGTNVTGLFLDQARFTAHWFELLREGLPQAKNLNLLWDASAGPWHLGAAKSAAARLRFDTDTLVVRDERDFETELADGMRNHPDAMVLLSSPLVRARSAQLAAFCSARRLPAVSPFFEFARAGGLMSYGPDVQDYYLRTSVYVERILHGARVAEMALDLPENFRFVINETAAGALGLTLPPTLLAKADEVIR